MGPLASRALFVLIAPFVVATLAGCMTGDDVESRFEDADRHHGKRFMGGVEETKTATVPAGAGSLRVAAAWDISGGATFSLHDPTGRVMQSEEIGGRADSEDDRWFSTSTPTPGEWKLHVSAGGDGAYSFGFYY